MLMHKTHHINIVYNFQVANTIIYLFSISVSLKFRSTFEIFIKSQKEIDT
jgi:hypothetical protein